MSLFSVPQDLLIELFTEWLVDENLVSLGKLDVAVCCGRLRQDFLKTLELIQLKCTWSKMVVCQWIYLRKVHIHKLVLREHAFSSKEACLYVKLALKDQPIQSLIFNDNAFAIQFVGKTTLAHLTKCKINTSNVDYLNYLAKFCGNLRVLRIAATLHNVDDTIVDILRANPSLVSVVLVENVNVNVILDIQKHCPLIEDIFINVDRIRFKPVLEFMQNRGKLKEIEIGSDTSGFQYREDNESTWKRGLHVSGSELSDEDVAQILSVVHSLELTELLVPTTSLSTVSLLLSHSAATMLRLSIRCDEQCDLVVRQVLMACCRLEFLCFNCYDSSDSCLQPFQEYKPGCMKELRLQLSPEPSLQLILTVINSCPALTTINCNAAYDTTAIYDLVSCLTSRPTSQQLRCKVRMGCASLDIVGSKVSGTVWDRFLSDTDACCIGRSE